MIAPVLSDDPDFRFPSLASLRSAHGELLRRQRDSAEAAAFLVEVETFLRRGRSTGAVLDETEQRWEAQSILDYWATFLFRAKRRNVDATLDDFDPELAPRLADADCPYVGLDAFRESRFEVFFGRKRMIDLMVERLAAERFLAVVGDSGSGKSSVVLAGVLPALKSGSLPGSGTWRYLPPVVPGPEPLVNLARAFYTGAGAETVASRAARLREEPRHLLELAGEDGRPSVLIVDQFEEVFTLCEDEASREAFVAGLAALVESPGLRHTVLLTMRSEYQAHVAKLEGFQELFETARAWVTPLSSPELRDAIVRPAELRGLKFEEGVVDALLRDILGEPAGLPLLQFTLLKLWESRERNWVTWEAYRKLGSGRLALARSADAFYDALALPDKNTTRRILLRMVRTSESLEVTSSRVRRKDLHSGGEAPGWIDHVLDKLVAAHLVRLTPGETPEEDQFEVAHEALVRNWPALVDWLEQERAEITTRRRLEAKVEEWLRLKKQGGLLDEIQLVEAERWLGSKSAGLLGYHPELPALVQASREAIEEAKRKQEDARQRELEQVRKLAEAESRRAELRARSSRIFRALAVIMAVLFLLSVGAGYRAYRAQNSLNSAQLQIEQSKRRFAEQERNRLMSRRMEERKAAKAAQLRTEETLTTLQTQKRLSDNALEANTKRQLAEKALQDEKDQQKELLANIEREQASKALAEALAERERTQTALLESNRQKQDTKEALDKFLEQKRVTEEQQRAAEEQQRAAEGALTEAYAKPALLQTANRILERPKELQLDQRTRPLRLGASIGSPQVGRASLCCVVKDSKGHRYLLSLRSIFTGEPGAPILQPGPLDGGRLETDKIATFVRAGQVRGGQDSLKAGAIARLDPGVEVDFHIPGLGKIKGLDKIKGLERTVYPGDKVRLVGRSSGIVEGRVIRVNDREVVTTIVARPGDDGAAVLSNDGDLVGLLWGSNQAQPIVLRIVPILRELDVELVER